MTATTNPRIGTDATRRSRPSRPIMLALDVRDEMRMIRREPATLFFSIVMPVAFFALFVGMYGGETSGGGLPARRRMCERTRTGTSAVRQDRVDRVNSSLLTL